MLIQDIDRDFLAGCLRKILGKSTDTEATATLLSLDIVQTLLKPAKADHEDIALRYFLYQTIQNNLAFYREPAHIPEIYKPGSRAIILKRFSHDVKASNVELRLWSVLYHSFVVKTRLTQKELAFAAPCDDRTIRNWINEALDLFIDYLREKEFETTKLHLKRNIPVFQNINLANLVDMDPHITNVVDMLLKQAEQTTTLISIEGLGGIGKTALALAVTHYLADNIAYFEDIFWLEVRQTRERAKPSPAGADNVETKASFKLLLSLAEQLDLPTGDSHELQNRIRTRCQYHQYLLVVDNIEKLEDISDILPFLQHISELGSSIILTSRVSLADYGYIKSYKVQELTPTAVHHMLNNLGDHDTQIFSLDVAEEIYEIVGGIPLVIRLISGMARFLDTTNILKQIKTLPTHANFNQINSEQDSEVIHQAIFTHIYWSLWDALEETEQDLLIGLGLYLPPEGDNLDEIYEMATHDITLTENQVVPALQKLIEVHLVNVIKFTGSYQYALHRLTYTYINAHIFEG